MQTIKYIMLFFIFITSIIIGKTISQKYKERLEELEDIKNCLEMFKTKIKYTYEPLKDVFCDISRQASKTNISKIFKNASENLESKLATQSWIQAIENTPTNLKKEDLDILKNLSKLLGKSELEGQISQIEITVEFLQRQINDAQFEKQKNEKLYNKLGPIIGLVIVIMLI